MERVHHFAFQSKEEESTTTVEIRFEYDHPRLVSDLAKEAELLQERLLMGVCYKHSSKQLHSVRESKYYFGTIEFIISLDEDKTSFQKLVDNFDDLVLSLAEAVKVQT